MSSPKVADLHEWLSFEDDDEDRTWIFDVTFLTSQWTCIFGRGCPGVLTAPAPELVQGCCSYGAHFTGEEDRANIEARAAALDADEWQFKPEADDAGGPLHQNADGDWVTHLVDDACIFLNRPGFERGPGCALHQAAMARDERPLDWKPEVCWQLPLRRVDETDTYGHVTSTVREWKRRDWGDGGFDFHWWCTDAPDAFVGAEPVYLSLRDELVELCGVKPYQSLVELLAHRQGVALPHPALRAKPTIEVVEPIDDEEVDDDGDVEIVFIPDGDHDEVAVAASPPAGRESLKTAKAKNKTKKAKAKGKNIRDN